MKLALPALASVALLVALLALFASLAGCGGNPLPSCTARQLPPAQPGGEPIGVIDCP